LGTFLTNGRPQVVRYLARLRESVAAAGSFHAPCFSLQNQLSRLFGRHATSELMSIAIGMEVMYQPDFMFLPDLSLTERIMFSTCAFTTEQLLLWSALRTKSPCSLPIQSLFLWS
jgi:hypothetical protein